MKQLFLLSTVLVFFQITNAQNEDSVMIRKIADDILTNGKAYDNLRDLTKKIRSQNDELIKTHAENWSYPGPRLAPKKKKPGACGTKLHVKWVSKKSGPFGPPTKNGLVGCASRPPVGWRLG